MQPQRSFGQNGAQISAGQNNNWNRRMDNQHVGDSPNPRFGWVNQYRPFRQGMYQGQQRNFRPQMTGQGPQPFKPRFGDCLNSGQQMYAGPTQGFQRRNAGRVRQNVPEDILGKCYVSAGHDHIAPKSKPF